MEDVMINFIINRNLPRESKDFRIIVKDNSKDSVYNIKVVSALLDLISMDIQYPSIFEITITSEFPRDIKPRKRYVIKWDSKNKVNVDALQSCIMSCNSCKVIRCYIGNIEFLSSIA